MAKSQIWTRAQSFSPENKLSCLFGGWGLGLGLGLGLGFGFGKTFIGMGTTVLSAHHKVGDQEKQPVCFCFL